MTVVPLEERDRAATIALWELADLTRPWNDPGSDFDRAIGGTTSAVLGVRAGREIVASVMVGDDGHRGWVYYLAVAPGARRRGLGRQLMAAAEGWLTSRGVGKLNLMVRSGNEEAAAFYQAIGYSLSDVAVMARWIRGAHPDRSV
jgi:ribosomal protein S18 acetylase RimI-like enzyme